MRAFACLLVLLLTSVASAQNPMRPGVTDGDFDPTAPPPDLRGVTVDQRIGAAVPLDGGLRDEDGEAITMGELLADGKPVVLDLGYYECPLICPTVKRGIAQAVGASSATLGEDYRIVSISIDPAETPAVARAAQTQTAKLPPLVGIDDFGRHWRFLTGPEPAVAAIASAVGYGYRYLPKQDEFGHAAVIVFLAPDGTVTSYLPGSLFPPRQFDLAVGDAAQGRGGSVFQQVLQWCYRFDASQGKYVVIARNVMTIGGAVVMVVLAVLIGWMFRWEHQRKAGRAGPGPAAGS